MKPVSYLNLIFVSACVSHELPLGNSCNAANSVEDLAWLKAEGADLSNSDFTKKYWFITQATFRHETVFIVRNCCPTCNTLPSPVYSCHGELLFRASDEQYSETKSERIIWKSTEYLCSF